MRELNEHAINPEKVPPKYSAKQLIEIAKIIYDDNLGFNSLYVSNIANLKVPEHPQESMPTALIGFEESLRTMFHESYEKILYTPYEDLPLLVNMERLKDSSIIRRLYLWRINCGK